MTRSIDLNSDVGESFGPWPMGADEALIPEVTSVNVACGAHAGDPLTIERTVRLCLRSGVAIGAHPGYPDLAGFGRRDLEMTAAELTASVLYQVAAVAGMCRAAGAELRHVKPHGALYNRAARDPATAEAVVQAVRSFSRELAFVGLAGSCLVQAAEAAGLRPVAEAFADRAYEADGRLRARSLPGAVLPTPEAAAEQAVAIVTGGEVIAHDGQRVPVQAETLCIHGDTPDAAGYARQVRAALREAGVTVRAIPGP